MTWYDKRLQDVASRLALFQRMTMGLAPQLGLSFFAWVHHIVPA